MDIAALADILKLTIYQLKMLCLSKIKAREFCWNLLAYGHNFQSSTHLFNFVNDQFKNGGTRSGSDFYVIRSTQDLNMGYNQ